VKSYIDTPERANNTRLLFGVVFHCLSPRTLSCLAWMKFYHWFELFWVIRLFQYWTCTTLYSLSIETIGETRNFPKDLNNLEGWKSIELGNSRQKLELSAEFSIIFISLFPAKNVNKRREKTAQGCAVEATYPLLAFFLHAASVGKKQQNRWWKTKGAPSHKFRTKAYQSFQSNNFSSFLAAGTGLLISMTLSLSIQNHHKSCQTNFFHC
jgi:hypothetical protein